MKKISMLGMGLLVGCLGIQTQASTVYEGFDYTVGDAVVGQGTGDGWDGNWAGGDAVVDDGLDFGALSVLGGAAQRPSRSGNSAISRTISTDSQAALLADDSTMWFSVVMRTFALSTGDGGTAGFALNSWGTIVLGDAALTGGSGTSAAPIGSGGNAIGVGFAGTGGGGDFADIRVQGVVYTNGAYAENTSQQIVTGDAAVMIVGKVEWDAAGGTNDIVSLYNVSDPTSGLPEAFSTMTNNFDQSAFNVVSIGDAQTSVFDEIRFDTSLEGVMPVGEASSEVLWVDFGGDTQEGFQSGFSSVSGSAATNTYATDARTSSGSVDVMLEASTTLSLAVNRGTLTNGIPEGFTYADLYKDTISASGATAYLTLTLSGLTTNAVYKLTLYGLNPAYTTGTDDKEWSVTTGTPAPQTQSVNYTDTLVDNDTYAMEFVVTSTSNGVIAVQNTAGFNQSCINGFKLSTDLTLAAGDPSIVSITSVGSDVFMIECALDGNAAENVSPVTTDSLTVQGWEYIAHSDDGVNPFVIANLDYSTASGSNVVIYVEGTNSAGFFGLE
jgi:hypothetical protein